MRRALLLLAGVACTVPSDQKSFAVPPSSAEFHYVSDVLSGRCGSLDCHGQPGRALRLYGTNGLRLAPDDVPGVENKIALQPESDANYAAVVALEPEAMQAVLRDGGRDSDRLTLLRKALGVESHTGGRALDENGRRCFVSWLEGNIDRPACAAAKELAKPPGFAGAGGTGAVAGTGGTGGSGGGLGGGSGGTIVGGGGSGGLGGAGGTTASGGLGGWNGGTSGTGGTTGSGGISTGGEGGVVCGPFDPFWPCTYDAACEPPKPSPADHVAYAKTLCQSCHVQGGSASPMLLAGVVWEWGAKKGAAHVEVAVWEGTNFIYTCTDWLGFFSVPAGIPEPNWLTAESRIRALYGEKIMPADKEHKSTCNDTDCHAHPEHQLWAP